MLDIDQVCKKKPFQRIKCEDTDCPYGKLPNHCVEVFLGQHYPKAVKA